MPEDKITLNDLREDSAEVLAAMPATVSNKELETVMAIGSMAAVRSFLDHIRKEQRFSKPFARRLFPDLGRTVAQSMGTEFKHQGWILKPQTTYIKHYLDTYGLSRIKDLSETTIEGLRQALEINIVQGIDPRAASRMIRPQIGLTARQSGAVNRRYFKMLEDGIRPDVARARAQRYHDHLLRYRADTIARTELVSAQNHGKLEAWNEAADEGLYNKAASVKEWSAAADACDECLDLDGERQRLDEPFSAGVMCPTLHPRGRCSMNLIQNAKPTEPKVPRPEEVRVPPGKLSQEAWLKSLSLDEQKAIMAWQGGAHTDIRPFQRTGIGEVGTMRRSQLIEQSLNRAKPLEGTVYRGAQMPNEAVAAMFDSGTVKYNALTSASWDKDAVRKFLPFYGEDGKTRMMFHIKNKTGVDISAVQPWSTEGEVLMRRGSSYKIVGESLEVTSQLPAMREVESILHVFMEQI